MSDQTNLEIFEIYNNMQGKKGEKDDQRMSEVVRKSSMMLMNLYQKPVQPQEINKSYN